MVGGRLPAQHGQRAEPRAAAGRRRARAVAVPRRRRPPGRRQLFRARVLRLQVDAAQAAADRGRQPRRAVCQGERPGGRPAGLLRARGRHAHPLLPPLRGRQARGRVCRLAAPREAGAAARRDRGAHAAAAAAAAGRRRQQQQPRVRHARGVRMARACPSGVRLVCCCVCGHAPRSRSSGADDSTDSGGGLGMGCEVWSFVRASVRCCNSVCAPSSRRLDCVCRQHKVFFLPIASLVVSFSLPFPLSAVPCLFSQQNTRPPRLVWRLPVCCPPLPPARRWCRACCVPPCDSRCTPSCT